MNPVEKKSTLSRAVERALAAVARKTHRHPIGALALAALVALLSLASARTMTLDADLSALLPKSFGSVQALDTLSQRFGGVGFVVVVAMGEEAPALRRFADDLAPRLEALEEVRFVDFRRPLDFFTDHALYFLETNDLKIVRDRLAAREQWERERKNPMYVDLEGGEPPSLEFRDLRARYESRSDRGWMKDQAGEEYYLDPDKRMVALLAKPAKLSTDLTYAQKIVGQVRGLVDSIDLSQYGPNMKVALAGAYTKKVEQQALIESDLRLATLAALLLVLGYIAVHFRTGAAVVLIMLPLLLGLSWTYGFAALLFDKLNILTGFLGAILMGLGIDHGIHLLGRFEAEHHTAPTVDDAVHRTFARTGRAVTVAALTTTVAFAGISFSEFRAFREFGTIAAIGMVVVVAAYTACMPALLSIFVRWGWQPARRDEHAVAPSAGFITRHAGGLVAIVAVIAGLMGVEARQTGFDHDTRALAASHLPSFQLDHDVDRLLGYSQVPVIVLTDHRHERWIADRLRESQDRLKDASTIDLVVAGSDFVPDAQPEKRVVLREIGEILDRINPRWLDKEWRKPLKTAKRMAKAEPFTRAELPMEIRRQFEGVDPTSEDGFVLAFAAVDLSDGANVRAFAREVRGVDGPDGKPILVAGESMVLADILNMIAKEAPPVLLFTLLLVGATLWTLVGSFRWVLLCLTPPLLTLLGTFGVMPLVGLKFNYLNVLMVPVLFGVGVDGGVHLVTRLLGRDAFAPVYSEVGRAVAGAILTTSMGFGAMILADHNGLNSLGTLALLGLSLNLLACLVALPAILAWLRRLGLLEGDG